MSYEVVTCGRCGETGECTPWNDYYETPLWDNGRVCERCLLALARLAEATGKGLA